MSLSLKQVPQGEVGQGKHTLQHLGELVAPLGRDEERDDEDPAAAYSTDSTDLAGPLHGSLGIQAQFYSRQHSVPRLLVELAMSLQTRLIFTRLHQLRAWNCPDLVLVLFNRQVNMSTGRATCGLFNRQAGNCTPKQRVQFRPRTSSRRWPHGLRGSGHSTCGHLPGLP